MDYNKEKLEFLELEAYHWKIDEIKFYVMLDEKKSSEVQDDESRIDKPELVEIEYNVKAFILDDHEFGKIPYDVYEQKRRQDISHKLLSISNVHVNPAKVEVIALAPTSSSYPLIRCKKCLRGIPKESTYCPFCGSKLHVPEKYPRRNKSVITIFGLVSVILLLVFFSSTGYFTPAFEKEIKYYEKSGYTVYKDQNWEEFKSLEGIYNRVSKEELRQEADALARSSITIYADSDSRIIWAIGSGLDPEEFYILLWKPQN